MTDNNLVALCAALLAAAVTATPVACNISDNATMEGMVKGGAHPIDAMCAVKTHDNKQACTARAMLKEVR